MAQLQTSTDFSVNTPSTSTSTNCPKHYHDVFISHRGPDVKNTFATSLYRRLLPHRLRTFLDKDELQKGEYILPQIEDAISTAYIHIAIFSPGYAESRWCLDELLLILNKCKSGDTIIPVFYKVKPSELRWNTGRYAEALTDHEQKGRYSRQTLDNWRNALKDVSYIDGFELGTNNGDEDKLLEEVVECVLKKRRKTPLYVAAHPTGLEMKVQDFEDTVLSQQQKNGKAARVLGIVGPGGVGKTTLAKELFNKKSRDFMKSSFLYDVRETVRQTSLESLQSKLLKVLTESTQQICNIEEGIEILREHLSSLHALIVLDDVDHVDQLHALLPIRDILHSDSLILVTSRYKNVLTSSEIAGSSIYELKGLDYPHSEQLFCSHAFLQSYPLPEFKNLVDEFCKACDGLPLSLRVFGALLSGKDQSYWNGQLDKLRQIELPDEIQKRLKISYDALDKEERQIFLDISCYFIGEDRDMAVRIWDGSGWHGFVGLQNLQDKCLVEVGEKNTIKMHDHLRDLGRQIADQEKSSGVIPHRLWPLIEEIPGSWQQQSSVITQVRGIRTVPRFEQCFGFSGNCLRKLIDPSPYRLRNLQLLATEGDDLESILRRVESPNLIWLRWNNCRYTWLPQWIPMKNIRVLEVSGNKLETLWRAESQAPLKLRELTIESDTNESDYDSPSRLFEFPKSIGKLNNIEKIVVMYTGLKLLAEEFCQLRSLKYLDLQYSRCLQMLPDSFGCLINLQHLDISYSKLEMLPDSFGCLINLQHLDLSFCTGLQMLPNSFGNLIRLKYLNLEYCCDLTISDETFGNICSLEYLRLHCRLHRTDEVLPPQVAHQRSLEKLYLRCTNLQELPGDMGHLRSLKELRLDFCNRLKSLPDSLGLLTQLSELFIEYCGIQSLPPEMVKLNSLVKLTVKSCPIRELPLKKGVEGESAAELSRLEYLHLCNIKISEISFVDGVCPSLEHLDIAWCNDLVEVGALPPTLIKLSLGDCRKLSLGDCRKLCNLTNLQELDIYRCHAVEELPCLERFTSLKNFRAFSCYNLKRIRGLGQLTQLQYVGVIYCDALEELANLEDLMWLKRLQVYGCPKLQLGRGVEEQLRQRITAMDEQSWANNRMFSYPILRF